MIERKLSQREIQLSILHILQYFDEYCKRYKMRYYLVGGTLLGAIRHKGFIPWDDDIDVCMPRPDYERLIKTFKDNADKRYSLSSYDVGNSYRPYAKILDLSTKVVAKTSDDEQHLWIDVMPVDGLPDDEDKIKKIYQSCERYRNILNLTRCKLGTGKTLLRRMSKYFLQPLARLYGEDRLIKNIESIARSYDYENSKNVGAITWGIYGVREKMLKREFEKSVEVIFEGNRYPAFSCWQSYLSNLYGDYMELPPVEKRKTHEMEAYCLDR
ncbi:LicD family protein [Mitsuokella sp. WILCCON 0060]|uniref:LicD family protein n=1 Tax=Mitsuokella sp. WILCCON 0060 TaxID=3345341 RepID=UPI003F19A8F2